MAKNKRKNTRPRVLLSKAQKEDAKKEICRLANLHAKEIEKQAFDRAAEVSVACFALSVHDEFDFDRDQIMRGMKRYLKEFYAIVDGYICLEDIKNVLLEECKIDLFLESDMKGLVGTDEKAQYELCQSNSGIDRV